MHGVWAKMWKLRLREGKSVSRWDRGERCAVLHLLAGVAVEQDVEERGYEAVWVHGAARI